ncbi:MAG TPA: hypothetical protein VK150_01720, partial [Geothrix sp.]|nr:hypothetical protein [Geothrix sp.]
MIELFQCQALKARISKRQCRINQEQARLRSTPAGQRQCWNGRGGYIGPLHFCLECTQPEALEAKRLEAPGR